MADGNTIGRECLTELDGQVIDLCSSISKAIKDTITNEEAKKDFYDKFGKTNKSRDGGYGRGAGKLQRDALCTRGITSKGPFSNRNLRWHPLVIAHSPIPFAKPIERIEIEGENNAQSLIFIVNENGVENGYSSPEVYKLTERFVTLPQHWQPHIDNIKFWSDNLWVQNSCIITAFESCNWWDAVETYAILGISVAVEIYNVSFEDLYPKITEILQGQTISDTINLPTQFFPTDKQSIVNCPLCKLPTSENPANLPDREREERFTFGFKGKKRGEGDEGSRQVMHINPLTEIEIRHTAQNVRFSHRWCNVAMTDHSISETLDFMEYIVKAHGR